MADIELVVKIDEDAYRYAKKYNGSSMLTLREEEMGMCMDAIANGTPLPKGHGKLIDADDIDNHIIGHVDTRSCPTIIEADTAESEGNNGRYRVSD